MPKQIPDLRASLLAAGRRILFEEGYRKFTMRLVARTCGIALGTAYNYFESKELLIANIMLEDWTVLLKKTEAEMGIPVGPAAEERAVKKKNAGILFGMIREFSLLYKDIWFQYAGAGHASEAASDRHMLLITQLTELSRLDRFTAEVILHFATMVETGYSEIEPYLDKLL